jgi:two-component sensor histidine kinase
MFLKSSVLLRFARKCRQDRWRGYGFSLLLFSLALMGRFVVNDFLTAGFPFLTFFPAIVLTTLFAGRGPGMTCSLLSLLSAWYWFIAPRHSFSLDFEGAIAVCFFAVIALVDVLVIDLMTRAVDSLEALQKQTDALVVQRTTLFHELQHRVANNLMTVATSLRVQERRLKHLPEAVTALETVRQKFEILSGIHRRLHDPANGRLPFGPYLQGLCDDFLDASERKMILCKVESSEIAFDADRTVTLSLIVLESLANSVKHAFAPDQAGSVTVRLTPPSSGRPDHVLTIEDDGRGIRADFESSSNDRLGMNILKGFARSLDGEVTVSAVRGTGGTIVQVNFPAW